jgi:hypothetical protein
MGKYVFIYYQGAESDGGSNEAWGNPFKEGGQAVHQGGVMPVQDKPVTGYSIVNADGMDAAVELAKDCPLTSEKDSAVCVYEALPM